MSDRTFSITRPLMEGSDIRSWQSEVRDQFDSMNINYPLKGDGIYGFTTRSATASLCHALGMIAQSVMEDGVTPELRTRIRHRQLTKEEKDRFADSVEYRRALRERYKHASVAKPVNKIIEATWGFHPPVHDGLDVICPPHAALYAMVKAKVVRADNGGWWGKAPSGDVTKGDGNITLEVLESVGPFKRGMQIGYGHAEHPIVKVGQIVEAGQRIGEAGFAVAWHVHLMIEKPPIRRGRGDTDPKPFLDYTIQHG